MTDETETAGRHPPVLGQPSPGLVWRPRRDGWVATWQARTDITKRGFRPKYVALWGGGIPNEIEGAEITTRCQHLQYDMLAWSRGVEEPPEVLPNHFTGTLKSLVHCYQTDVDSPFQKNRYHVRKNRRSVLKRIVARHGEMELSEIKARLLLAWHKEWSEDGKRLATGSTIIGQLRALFSFGATLLENPDCERLCGVMHKMRFPGTKPRSVSLSADQASDICETSREHFGWNSIALGQSFQFECTLRQMDVIGSWVPVSEPGISAVVRDGRKWLRGIVWSEIDENLILRHITSKKQKMMEADLKLAPLVLRELQILVGDNPLVVVDEITKRVTVNRRLLPAAGPVILNDVTAWPWSDNEYRRKWRLVADKAGVPKNITNMDSRSGAISEAIQAGAPMEFVRHAATHSDVSQTADYDRGQAEATAKVMKMRMESRNRPKTGRD